MDPDSAFAPSAPAVLGNRFELGPAIGSGGFGTVFRALDVQTRREVAVKLVPPGLGSEPAAQRLRREGLILRRVASRHVAQVIDTGDDDHGVWLVMELVDGAPLRVPTFGRALLPHEVLRVARGLLEGLAAVHAAGIVHGDVKPSNVLVATAQTRGVLDSAKLVDFGLARIVSRSEVAASIGDAMMREGTVLGTAKYMAPEILSGGEPTPRSDIYGAGLVLFELLDQGALFPVGDGRAQLRARVSNEPSLEERVPEPLSDVLMRMLARDPSARYASAVAAHEAVIDLDTAPVSVVRDESIPPSARDSTRMSIPAPPIPSSRSTVPPLQHPVSIPTAPPLPSTMRGGSAGATAVAVVTAPGASSTSPPPSIRPASESRRRVLSPPPAGGFGNQAPVPSGIARLSSLPADGVAALRETLRHLDLPMLDALARRERGNPIGRIARAVALALRLELDAAALILEPLAMQSDVARAIGAAVLAPRARRVTRARVDSDREDKWVESMDAELCAMLVALAVALSTHDDAARDANRCARALARLEALPFSPTHESLRTTVRIAHAAARVRKGELDRGSALDLVVPLMPAAASAEAPFHVVVRALACAALHIDDRASIELERAERIAAETGTTLLDACTATTLGMLLAQTSPRDERGLHVLERAGTLLAHGDAPSLEHEAEQCRATVLIALSRFHHAIAHLRAAREAAHAERAGDLELLSASLEVMTELATGDTKAAYESAAVLGDARLTNAKGRTAALAWVARSLVALSAADRDRAEDALTEAEARVREADRNNADVYVLVEILGMLFDAARGALPDIQGALSGLERFAEEHGFEAFYWFDLLESVVLQVPDQEVVRLMQQVLTELGPVLGPGGRLARERRTDAPPSAVF